jgi:hypothetical protein
MTVHTERFGTRHRAALGITEQTDALVVVVSEENGQISLVERARIVRNLTEAGLSRAIQGLLDPAAGRRGAFGWRSAAHRADLGGRSPRLGELGRLVGRTTNPRPPQATISSVPTPSPVPNPNPAAVANPSPATGAAPPLATKGGTPTEAEPPAASTAGDDDVMTSAAARAPR